MLIFGDCAAAGAIKKSPTEASPRVNQDETECLDCGLSSPGSGAALLASSP